VYPKTQETLCREENFVLMTKYKLEYIWLDGKKPVPGLRGKSLLKSFEKPPTLADIPNWGFDGSSTMQAEGKSSDCVLKPVALYPDASRKDALNQLSRDDRK
jgi:glutamine synthetase